MEVDRERCVRNRGGDDAGVTTRDGWMDASCASLGLRGSTTGRAGEARARVVGIDTRGWIDRSRWNRSVRARVSSGSHLGRRERVDEDVGVVRVIARAGVDDDDDGGGWR